MQLLILISLFLNSLALAQTRINLGSQASNVDFSAAAFTRPVKTGTGLPASCMFGELYFRQDTQAGQNLYGCTAPNSWSALNAGNTPGDNRWTGSTAFAPSPVLTIGAGARIAVGGSTLILLSANSPVTLVTTPTVEEGTDGQVVILLNRGSYPVTLQDEATLTGSKLCLAGDNSLVLAPSQSAFLVWSSAAACWSEASRNIGLHVSSWNGLSGNILPAIGSAGNSPAWSGATLQLPMASAAGVTAGLLSKGDYDVFSGKANSGHTHTAGDTVSGRFSTARLGSGTAAADTFLRGDGSWHTVPFSPFIKEFPAAVCQSAAGSLALNAGTATQPVADCAIGSNTYYGVAKFADSATYALQGNFRLPGAVSSLKLDVDWRTAVTNSAFGAVWQLQTACVSDDEDDDPVWNAPQWVRSAAKAVSNRMISASISSVTLTGCAADERLFFNIYRDPLHSGDDLSATAELIAIRFTVGQ